SSLANNAFNTHTPFTSFININDPGNIAQSEQARLFQIESEVDRVAANFLTVLGSSTLPTLGTKGQDLRAQAFANFLRGLSVGYIALMYDSLSVVNIGQAGDDAGKLIAYTAAAESAYVYFDLAITAASDPAASPADKSGFPLP